jgi:6-phosphogluconolactonase (cycloisomerase 2 family)
LEIFFRELRMLKKAAAMLLICAGVATWSSCHQTTSNGYVYAVVPAPSQIVIYREDPASGVLTALPGSPFAGGPGASAIAVHPSKQYLYTANGGQSDISLYDINGDGTLSEVTPRTSVVGIPVFLAMDPAGNYLYVGCNAPSSVQVFSIGSGGALSMQPISTSEIGTAPLGMAVTPGGGFLYITGASSSVEPGFVQAFSLSSGTLTPVPGTPFTTGRTPEGMAISPNGSFLYVANYQDNTISEFGIGPTGALSILEGSPVGETYQGPLALQVDNTGSYLYVANKTSGNVAAYSISSGGTLLVLGNSPFGAGGNPGFLAIDPSGNFLFVGTQGGNPQVQSFSLSTGSGTLVSVANYGVGSGSAPTSIAVIH